MTNDGLNGIFIGGALPEDERIQTPQLKKVDAIASPSMVDLRPHCSPVENQAKVGSCVANAVVGALEYNQIRNGSDMRDLSRLFVYYNARKLGERIGSSGTTIHRAMAAVLGWGACPAGMWPYQTAMVDVAPTDDCYAAAQNFKALQIAQTGWGIGCREALASGLPVAFAMRTARRDFGMAGHTAELRPPKDGNWTEAGGGHAMLMVGYSDDRHAWLVRNSWGTDWGDGGHVWIDYDYLPYYTTGENYRAPPYAIGQIEDVRAYEISGPSLQDFASKLFGANMEKQGDDVSVMRNRISSELDTSLDKARKDIRDRLRGPGAGGGYDKGPGAGGGY